MLRASVDTILKVTHGELLAGDGDTFAVGLSTDSRACEAGCVYVALHGERADGHDFLMGAIERGARVLLVTRPAQELVAELTAALGRGAAVVRVIDPIVAIQRLAAYHRGRLLCPVVGVTGSTGKTTTKDFLRAVLGTEMHVVSTVANHNNELGVPLTVLSAGTDTDVLVVEMGMRGRGQIAELCDIVRPTMGLVTNVGTSHIEILGSREALIEAKGELPQAVPQDGAVFLNGDDEASLTLASVSKAPVTYYGLEPECSVRARDIVLDDEGRASFMLDTPQGSVAVSLPNRGRHNVYNALAASAVALRLAVGLEHIAEGLASASFSGMRMETFTTASGVVVLNDAYNANPTSMRAAVDTLAVMHPTGKRIAVLGDMAELGNLGELAHFEIGQSVARAGIEALVAVGRSARRIYEGARAEGMSLDAMRYCTTAAEALGAVSEMAVAGDVVLVKASRVMKLETVVEGMVSRDAR